MTTAQYLRKFSLLLSTASGDTIDLSDFRVTFAIRRGDFQTPNSADLRIWNLSDTTAKRIYGEFTEVVVQAGYEGNYRIIFNGTIKQVRLGRVDQKDSYVDVTAADGDEAYNFSVINKSSAANTKPDGTVALFLQSIRAGATQQTITQGTLPKFSSSGSFRGTVHYGLVRDELREFSENNDCAWSIQNGALTMIPLTGYISGDIPVLSPTTGLIGVPEQTQNGIKMRVLLNPYLKIGQAVRLDSSAINLYRYGLDIQSQGSNAMIAAAIKTNADGLYYVMVADYVGDTRGNDWYTDLTCLSVDATVLPTGVTAQGGIVDAAIRMF